MKLLLLCVTGFVSVRFAVILFIVSYESAGRVRLDTHLSSHGRFAGPLGWVEALRTARDSERESARGSIPPAPGFGASSEVDRSRASASTQVSVLRFVTLLRGTRDRTEARRRVSLPLGAGTGACLRPAVCLQLPPRPRPSGTVRSGQTWLAVDLTQLKRRRCRGWSCVTPRWGWPCSVSSQRLSCLARAGPSVEAAGDETSPCGARGLSSGVVPLGPIRPKVWTGVFAHCHCVPNRGEVGVAAGTGRRWPRRVPGKSPVAVALLGQVRPFWFMLSPWRLRPWESRLLPTERGAPWERILPRGRHHCREGVRLARLVTDFCSDCWPSVGGKCWARSREEGWEGCSLWKDTPSLVGIRGRRFT